MIAGSDTTRSIGQHRWSDLAAIGVFAVMLVEMMIPIKSTTSIKALLLFILVYALTNRWPLVSRGLLLFAVPAGAYIATAVPNVLEYSIIRADVINVGQTGILMAFIGAARFATARRERFYANLHLTFMWLGLGAAAGGLIKVFLWTRGIELPYLRDEENYYPGGSSLQKDYNTYMAALMLALSSTFWLMSRTRSRIILHLCHLGWPVLVGAMILTGSRRAVIFLASGLLIWLGEVVWRRIYRARRSSGSVGSFNKWVIGCNYLCVVTLLAYAPAIRNPLVDILTSSQISALWGRTATVSNAAELMESREIYWKYSWDALGARDVVSLLIGDGFTYVSELGQMMGRKEDYPHNFMFSSMLYGGAVQTVLLLLVIGIGFIRALRTTLSGRFLFFWLLIAVLFLLSSSNSFFSSELSLAILILALDTPGKPLSLTGPNSSGKQPSGVNVFPSRSWVPL